MKIGRVCIEVRIAISERQKLKEIMEAAGFKTYSAYFRYLVLQDSGHDVSPMAKTKTVETEDGEKIEIPIKKRL